MTFLKKFSHSFKGLVWNVLTVVDGSVLLVEVRDESSFQTKFYAFDVNKNEFLWQDRSLEEKWWISLVAAGEKIVLLQTYQGSGNPDRKNLVAIRVSDGEHLWTVQNFSLYGWGKDDKLLGFSTRSEFQQATVDTDSGEVTLGDWATSVLVAQEISRSPETYLRGSDHFESIETFIRRHDNIRIVHGVEYLEMDKIIGISYYVEDGDTLANYLLVIDKDGNRLLKEKLGENLPGLGVHTFFALRDCVIFVKNKCELVSYSLYD